MNITRLTPDYLPRMAAIEAEVHSHPMSEAALADCFGPLYRVSGITLDSGLEAFAIVQQILDEATLFDICVASAMQGKGLGKILMKSVIDDARDAGAALLMLEVRAGNHAAIALYRDCGLLETGRRKGYYPAKGTREDALLMTMHL